MAEELASQMAAMANVMQAMQAQMAQMTATIAYQQNELVEARRIASSSRSTGSSSALAEELKRVSKLKNFSNKREHWSDWSQRVISHMSLVDSR